MKKGVQIAFAIALVVLSIICTIIPNAEIMTSIVYAIILPSFICSFISFVTEISLICEQKAKKLKGAAKHAAELAGQNLYYTIAGCDKSSFTDGNIPSSVVEKHQTYVEWCGTAEASANVEAFFARIKKKCNIISTVCYVFLFLSLILSPYIAKILSVINLNCITLWSLTVLYLSVELKTEICGKIYATACKKEEQKMKNTASRVDDKTKDTKNKYGT